MISSGMGSTLEQNGPDYTNRRQFYMGIKAGKIWGNTELIHANGVLEFHRIEFKAGFKCSEHEHRFKWNG